MKTKILWAVSIGIAVGIAQAVLGDFSFLERFIAAYGGAIMWHSCIEWYVENEFPEWKKLMKDMAE